VTTKRKNPHAVALGRLGGRGMTPKKLKALKRNAQTAGRKPKFQIGDHAVVSKGPLWALDRACLIERVGPGRAEYVVRFFDDRSVAVLESWYLDKP
jgi:hypothetical protein